MFCRACHFRLAGRILSAPVSVRSYKSRAGVYGCRPESQASFGEGKC